VHVPRKEHTITMSVTKSFVTDKPYVEIQGRMRDGTLHIQGRGSEVNRQYGVAVNVQAPKQLADWLDQQSHTLFSLAGTVARYVPMQARIKGGRIHVQVAGTPLNRGYGAAFDVDGAADLEAFIRNEVGDDAHCEGSASLS